MADVEADSFQYHTGINFLSDHPKDPAQTPGHCMMTNIINLFSHLLWTLKAFTGIFMVYGLCSNNDTYTEQI